MTDREAIDVLFNEWKCIDRNDGIHCDRKCESCDLVMDVEIIREAFNMAISALQTQDSKTRKICDTCKHDPPSKKWPCVDCDMRNPADRWEPKGEQVAKILADILDGCPLVDPCNKIWALEGWCKDHCKPGQQEPDSECWLKYAEIMVEETENSNKSSLTQNTLDVPEINVGGTVSRQAAIDALMDEFKRVPTTAIRAKNRIDCLPSAQPEGWLEQNKAKILQAGMEGREIEFRIGGRLFAIREKAQ